MKGTPRENFALYPRRSDAFMHYLDNSATTKPCAEAVSAVMNALEVWGNPSSVHHAGIAAADALKEYRIAVSRTLGIRKGSADRLYFTSCGTESNNIAMMGTILSKKRNPNENGIYGTVIISDGEHPSMEKPAERLSHMGYRLVRVPTVGGVLDLDFLRSALENAKAEREPVIFAGFMLVNNETGAVYDVKAASALVKRYYPDATVHCDAVQGYMKLKFTPATLGADLLSVSAHKIHAPRGAAALFVSGDIIKRKNLVPVMPGGGQEDGFRSGTENLCGIAGFAAAACAEYTSFEENRARTASLRAMLDEGISSLASEGVGMNIPRGAYLANIASVTLPNIRSETMLNYLSGKEIYVSAGSACSAHSKKKSAALTAFGAPDSVADSTIRVSLSHTNTEDDISAFISALRSAIRELQRK